MDMVTVCAELRLAITSHPLIPSGHIKLVGLCVVGVSVGVLVGVSVGAYDGEEVGLLVQPPPHTQHA